MRGNQRLAIIDWGIGGIGISKLIKSRLGDLPVTYFSDTGVTPYGKMTRRQLVSRLNAVVAFLRSSGVTHLAVGCNAASTAIPFLSVGDLNVVGVIESAVDAAAKLRPAKLALIGGRRTVLSGVYRRAFADRGMTLTQRIAQPLSGLIEGGDVSSHRLVEQCRGILAPVQNCSHLLLACTHYPAIIPVLKRFLRERTVVIDPAGELVDRIKRWRLPEGGGDTAFTTGDPENMRIAAWKAFGVRITAIRQVTL